jgi:hypothetical protein
MSKLMAGGNFLNSDNVRKALLYSIYDVDEFVLGEVERLKTNNLFDVWDLSNAKRYSYETCQVGENKYEESEISTDDYLYRCDEGDRTCFTKLNYEDFETDFPLAELDEWYGDEWLYDFHINKAFFQEAINWIDNTDGDASKKLHIQDLIDKIKTSQFALENIEKDIKSTPINAIQKKVIQIHKRLDDVLLESISARYSPIFPSLFLNTLAIPKDSRHDVGFKLSKPISNSKQILDQLIFNGLLKKGTLLSLFKNAFNSFDNKKIETPLIWTGSKRALNYFIKILNDKNILDSKENRYQKHWQYGESVFRDKNGDKITNLSGNNQVPANKKKIDQLIRCFNMV